MRKLVCLILAAVLLLGICGCAAVGEIAGSVADAAVKELENQLKGQLEKNKVQVIELKTAFGKLNDDGGEMQFFIAALVKTDNTATLEACKNALDAVFEEKGWESQDGSKVENANLVHKEITFKHTDFSEGNYYIVYGYAPSITGGLLEGKGE